MPIPRENRHIILYGLVLALLVLALKWLQWQFLILDNAIEIYIGFIALFFTLLGIWLARQLTKPKVKTVVVEKEVPIVSVPDKSLLEELNLSSREYEVLQLLAKGQSNNDIAENLYLSTSTVKTHLYNLYSKMEVKSRTQAMEKAKRLKNID